MNYEITCFDLISVMIKQTEIRNINRFYATDLFLYPLSTSENQRSSDVFKGFKERPLTWKGLIKY